MTKRILLLTAALLIAACSRPNSPLAAPGGVMADTAKAAAAAAAVPDFANRIWKVADGSAGDPGTYYVFLSDGSMLVTSPHGKPAIGSWHLSGEMLTLTEEGLPHPAAVFRQTADTFGIRIAGPGAPVQITFVRGVTP
jgi:hypothetical protein